MKKIHTFKALTQVVLLSLLLAACGGSSNTDNNPPATADTVTIDINPSGKYAIPPVDGNASASGSITLNKDSGALSGQVTASNLSGAITAAHIHAAVAGKSGGIVITLEVDSANANQLNVPAGTVLDQSAMDALLAANYYVNIHTAAHAGGEVRGQIVPDGYQVMRAELKGENQLPAPVVSSNSGIAYVTVNTSTGAIDGNLRNSGLDDASAAHIHNGFAGSNGGVVVGLVQDSGDTGFWTIPASTVFDAAQLANLMAGGYYFNVHTPANPAGEARAQVTPDNVRVVRSELDGSQVVPPVTTSASAVAYTTVDEDNGAVVANVWLSGLSATAGHIHMGAAGLSGGIALSLTQDATEASLWSATGTLDASQLMLFKSDGLYYNIHSAANPGGEIRGQIDG
jgi:hypothetical protein